MTSLSTSTTGMESSKPQMICPQTNFLEVLREAGAEGTASPQGELFTIKQICFYLKEYIKLKQLYNPLNPVEVFCGKDPLGKVFGLTGFTVHQALDLVRKHTFPVTVQPPPLLRKPSEIIAAQQTHREQHFLSCSPFSQYKETSTCQSSPLLRSTATTSSQYSIENDKSKPGVCNDGNTPDEHRLSESTKLTTGIRIPHVVTVGANRPNTLFSKPQTPSLKTSPSTVQNSPGTPKENLTDASGSGCDELYFSISRISSSSSTDNAMSPRFSWQQQQAVKNIGAQAAPELNTPVKDSPPQNCVLMPEPVAIRHQACGSGDEGVYDCEPTSPCIRKKKKVPTATLR